VICYGYDVGLDWVAPGNDKVVERTYFLVNNENVSQFEVLGLRCTSFGLVVGCLLVVNDIDHGGCEGSLHLMKLLKLE
jgi:hypothetical protein